MNRLVRGSIMLAATVVTAACSSSFGDNEDQTDHLIATPSVVYVENDGSETVDVEAVNSEGNQLEAAFEVSNVGAGIVVEEDTSFAPILGGPPATKARFIITPATISTFVSTTFDVTANGKTITIPVSVVPTVLVINFSNPTPGLGEQITFTAPANVLFTDSTIIAVGASDTAAIVSVSPDGSTITFLLGPNITDQTAVVSNIAVSYIPGQVFNDVAVTGSVTTPVVTNIPATFDNTSPAVGDTVTMTLTAPFKALPGVGVDFTTGPAIITGISADSSSVSFLPPPTSTGAPDLSNVIISGVPVPLALPATATLTVANSTTYTGTDDFSTAPEIAVPDSGTTTGFFDLGSWAGDCGGVPCQWYKIVITTPVSLDFSSAWDNTADLGIYVVESDASTGVDACDAHANGSTAQPEECTIDFTAAGTYYIQMQNFAPFYPDPDPAWFKITMTIP